MSIFATKRCDHCGAATLDVFAKSCGMCGDNFPPLVPGYEVKQHDTIESLLAELAAEREKVRNFSATEAAATIPAVLEYAKDKEKQLAAAQLDNQRMREALERCYRYDSHDDQWYFDGTLREDTLSTPADHSALDAYVAEKVEPWKKDAERYRWLRYGDNDEYVMRFASTALCGYEHVWILRQEELDTVIDAAIAAQENKE